MLGLVSCECDACTALNAQSQLQDKCAESGQCVGSSFINAGGSTCKFVGATSFHGSVRVLLLGSSFSQVLS